MDVCITVVIPTYQRPHLLRQCLEALSEQRLPKNKFTTIVVDDANDPTVSALLQAVAQQTGLSITYLGQEQRRGPAAARNRGWQTAQTPFIAFTDDDCLPEPDWLSTAVTRFLRGAHVITGRVRMPLPERPTLHDRTAALLETAEFITANLFCHRTVLQRLHGFDERFDIAWREDSDLHFKLLEAGIPIVSCSDAVVIHPLRPTPWYATLRDERKNRYDALLFKCHPSLFLQRTPVYPWLVTRYYAIVVTSLIGIIGWLTETDWAATFGLISWLLLTISLVVERLIGQRITLKKIGTALFISLATPFLSVYWRLYGAFYYRVWFW